MLDNMEEEFRKYEESDEKNSFYDVFEVYDDTELSYYKKMTATPHIRFDYADLARLTNESNTY